MQYGESMDVADRVRRVQTSSHGGNTETAYRDYRESTEVVERVRMEYGQRGHSTDVLFKYGHVRTSAMFGLIYSLPI